ncbi:hypothetical protein BC628DRAFT_1199785 [Trametes gibbosa]|nr:hypothetical protein BC628DRAFT_1199785 [Trametes gibbosa]
MAYHSTSKVGVHTSQRFSTPDINYIVQRLSNPPPTIWCNDDVLYLIFSHLGPNDAARAALVYTLWHRHATNAAYMYVVLHSTSPSSLLVCPHLRKHVQHVTMWHFTPDHRDCFYEWLDHLPENTLKSCRILAVADYASPTASNIACIAADTLELVQFGSQRLDESFIQLVRDDRMPSRARLLSPWSVLPQGGRPDQCLERLGALSGLPLPILIEQLLLTLPLDPDRQALRETSMYRATHAGDVII